MMAPLSLSVIQDEGCEKEAHVTTLDAIQESWLRQREFELGGTELVVGLGLRLHLHKLREVALYNTTAAGSIIAGPQLLRCFSLRLYFENLREIALYNITAAGSRKSDTLGRLA